MAKIVLVKSDTGVEILFSVRRDYVFTGPVSNLPAEVAEMIIGTDIEDITTTIDNIGDRLTYDDVIDQCEITCEEYEYQEANTIEV